MVANEKEIESGELIIRAIHELLIGTEGVVHLTTMLNETGCWIHIRYNTANSNGVLFTRIDGTKFIWQITIDLHEPDSFQRIREMIGKEIKGHV